MKNGQGRDTSGLIALKTITLRLRNRTGSKVQTAKKNKRGTIKKVRNNYIFRRCTNEDRQARLGFPNGTSAIIFHSRGVNDGSG